MNKEQMVNYIFNYENQIFKTERNLLYDKHLSQEYFNFEKEYYMLCRRLKKNEDVPLEELTDLYKKIIIGKLYYGIKLNAILSYISHGEKENLLKRISNLYQIEDIDELQNSIEEINKYLSYLVTNIIKLSDEEYVEPSYSNNYTKINNKFAIQAIFEDQEIRKILSNEDLNMLFGAYLEVERYPEQVYSSIKSIIEKIWEYEITQELSNFKNGDNFCFLVHNFTTSYIHSSIDGINSRIVKSNQISTSLITDDNFSLYTAPTHKYGFIYSGNSSVVMAGHGDLYSGEGEGGVTLINKERGCKFFTPKVINYIHKKRKTKKNKEIDDCNDWNETIIEGTDPIGLFYISYGERDLDENYQNIKILAEKMKLPFIEIDARIYRKMQGLEEYNEQFYNYLIELLLKKNNIDSYSSSYMNEFIKYKENIEQIMNLYEKYTSGFITMDQFLIQVNNLDKVKTL